MAPSKTTSNTPSRRQQPYPPSLERKASNRASGSQDDITGAIALVSVPKGSAVKEDKQDHDDEELSTLARAVSVRDGSATPDSDATITDYDRPQGDRATFTPASSVEPAPALSKNLPKSSTFQISNSQHASQSPNVVQTQVNPLSNTLQAKKQAGEKSPTRISPRTNREKSSKGLQYEEDNKTTEEKRKGRTEFRRKTTAGNNGELAGYSPSSRKGSGPSKHNTISKPAQNLPFDPQSNPYLNSEQDPDLDSSLRFAYINLSSEGKMPELALLLPRFEPRITARFEPKGSGPDKVFPKTDPNAKNGPFSEKKVEVDVLVSFDRENMEGFQWEEFKKDPPNQPPPPATRDPQVRIVHDIEISERARSIFSSVVKIPSVVHKYCSSDLCFEYFISFDDTVLDTGKDDNDEGSAQGNAVGKFSDRENCVAKDPETQIFHRFRVGFDHGGFGILLKQGKPRPRRALETRLDGIFPLKSQPRQVLKENFALQSEAMTKGDHENSAADLKGYDAEMEIDTELELFFGDDEDEMWDEQINSDTDDEQAALIFAGLQQTVDMPWDEGMQELEDFKF